MQERNYIENLMSNWTSPGVGTYSPFGAVSAPERIPEIPIPQQKPLQPPAPLEEKVVPKKRMVAEVSKIYLPFISTIK
jgi:hypothetical protein